MLLSHLIKDACSSPNAIRVKNRNTGVEAMLAISIRRISHDNFYWEAGQPVANINPVTHFNTPKERLTAIDCNHSNSCASISVVCLRIFCVDVRAV